MNEIDEIKEVLTFLEEKFRVEFQLKILEEVPNKITDKKIKTIFKGCSSKVHHTDYLSCHDYYKKTF
ncbi:hypothetical protein [Flavobacterium humidisoli]|jgi:hypothetical protein|uniref:Uncharacterized protein n=1 Tax=Flavobacterium humidisoli TaxID=2937442 RepID=A0ABY4LY37_9FLAO|nr:hypothetical protein [Flavobacterium humidisoli]UPZ17991.1 hypothetical protein M0M44_11730 [Flavobacterium humidisoli]